MTCSVCGRRVDPDMAYCEGCGSAVPGAQVAVARPTHVEHPSVTVEQPTPVDHPTPVEPPTPLKRSAASNGPAPGTTSVRIAPVAKAGAVRDAAAAPSRGSAPPASVPASGEAPAPVAPSADPKSAGLAVPGAQRGFWAADPYGRARLRWWDGRRWTGYVHD